MAGAYENDRNLRPWCVSAFGVNFIVFMGLILSNFGESVIGQESGLEKIDFGSQIKPILADKCYACHGPDESKHQADFRIDQKASLLDPELGVLIPGDPDASPLIERILSTDSDEVMPPSDYLKMLTKREKELIVAWVKQGATWAEHWAFKPPVNRLKSTNESDSVKAFIDQSIQARLADLGLNSSDQADSDALLRRLNLDLIGLPPSPNQIAEFKADVVQRGFEEAYEHEVDRLLASPHFGERMAVNWLDLVRYADTVGYHGDQNVSISPYRDYVIEAFNGNMPFDQFTREQLAGDLLENPTQKQLIASGYNRLGMMSAEGGVQPEEYLNKYASDRVRTTASVWLGITLGCAECHDHKFDPFSSKEFYEFSAFFADIEEQGLYAGAHNTGKWGSSIDVVDEQLPSLLVSVDKAILEVKNELAQSPTAIRSRLVWETSLMETQRNWNPLVPDAVKVPNGVKAVTEADHSILIAGENVPQAVYGVSVEVSQPLEALRLEALPHKSLPRNGPGRASNGNFVVSELVLLRGDQLQYFDWFEKDFSEWPAELKETMVELSDASATVEQTQSANQHPDKKWSAASAIDRDTQGKSWGWAVLPQVGKSQELVVRTKAGALEKGKFTIVVRQQHGNDTHTLGHFRLSETGVKGAVANPLGALPQNIQDVLPVSEVDRTPEQKQTIHDYFVSMSPRYEKIRNRIKALEAERAQIVKQNTRITLVTTSVEPREIRVLARGDWMDKSGELVSPSVPAVLAGSSWEGSVVGAKPATRLDLANWMVSQENPLTARVFVNRIWRLLFGAGITNVLDDFGSQGEPPTHPEILDQLAVEFMSSGWDIKHLIREIVLTKSYRQASGIRTDLRELDPENRMLARQSRFRLDAEFIRDQALAVSGLLVKDQGGKSVMPYQPEGLYRHLNFPKRKYKASNGDDQYRRGLYTHWQRQFLHPAMKTFDAPSREECTAARPRSSTPLAALVLLNDPSYVEAARSLATLVLKKHSSVDQRINLIFKRAFSREVMESERKVVQALLESQLNFYEANVEKASELISIGQTPKPAKEELQVTDAELAAWTSVCRAVMNMHEFVLRK